MILTPPSSAGPARHVALIADGNGRWAQARNEPPLAGHEAGAATLSARIRDAIDFGIRQLTVYSFSTENWSRPATEVHGLLSMLTDRLTSETPALRKDGVQIRFVGRLDGLPDPLVQRMRWSREQTQANTTMTLFIALNYGARAEILSAARRFTGGGEAAFRRLLYDPDMHDPEVVIRTGGERRLSNYLLWQAAEAELVFRDELWPDFSRTDFVESLEACSPQPTDMDLPGRSDPGNHCSLSSSVNVRAQHAREAPHPRNPAKTASRS